MSENKLALILDIDGTLGESLFKNLGKDLQVLAKDFLDKLSKLQPYPLVIKEVAPLAAKADRILVVTGRQSEMATITKRWVTKVIGTNDYSIKFLHYRDYDQYILDKQKVLRKAIIDFDDLGYSTVMYEDDSNITRWVKQTFDFVAVRLVTNGIVTTV